MTAGATVTAIPVGGVCYVAATGSESTAGDDSLWAQVASLRPPPDRKKLGIYLGPAVTTVANDLYEVNTNGAEQI